MSVGLHGDARQIYVAARYGEVFGTKDGGESWLEMPLPEGAAHLRTGLWLVERGSRCPLSEEQRASFRVVPAPSHQLRNLCPLHRDNSHVMTRHVLTAPDHSNP